MLINIFNSNVYAQKIVPKDSIVISDSSIQEIISYGARDSLYLDIKKNRILLYGAANVKMEQTKMSAGFIIIDLNKNEIMASYVLDEDSMKIEKPLFTDNKENIEAEKIRYNLKSKKGFIEETTIKQDEIFINMGIAKRHANEEIHFTKGKFSTCNLEEPHYHFHLTKAILIPNDKIVTGPMNLWIKGVPTPLGLPFSILPQKEIKQEGNKGFIFPEIIPSSPYGFGFQDLGYFFPISNMVQTTLYANLYSRGSWGLRNDLEYAKRYGFKGNLSLGFQQFRSGFPENNNQNKISVRWIHNKDPKSNPFWKFSSNVNFISDNNSKNNLDPLNPDFFNNSFNSDININRVFPGKPVTTGLKTSLRQNSLTKNISLTAPTFNLNVTRVLPFKGIFKNMNNELTKTIKRIGITYGLEAQNRSNFTDSLLINGEFESIRNKFSNGINQQFTIQTTSGILKNTLKITPSINYSNLINFQQIEKTYDPALNDTRIDTLNKAGMAHNLSLNVSFTTMLYSYYKFIGKRETKLRHIMTPSIGYRYVPSLNELITVNAGINQADTITYSPFENSLYQASTNPTASLLNFGVNNTFEIKQTSDTDTSGFKKTRIIDQLSLTGSYDYQKDSMNLSDISMNLRISPSNWINIVSSNRFSLYSWDTTGATLSQYAFNNKQGIGRLMTSNFTTTLTLAPKKSREEIKETVGNLNENWNADFNLFALHPEQLILFNIPWKLNLSHVFGLSANTNQSLTNPDKWNLVHTVVLNGDISFTKRWKIAGRINLDVEELKISNAFFTLSRDMHCWALSFYWTPIGTNQSFLLSIKNKSNILSDAKLEFRKPPAFL